MILTYRHLGRRGRLGNALFEIASTLAYAEMHGADIVFPADWLHRPYFSVPDELFGIPPPDAIEAYEFATHLDERCREYMQDVAIFAPIMETVRRYFAPSPMAQEVLWQYELSHPIVGVHVRRGDNVHDPYWPDPRNKTEWVLLPSADYYERGLAEFPSLPVAFFSDDIPWCRGTWPDASFFSPGAGYVVEHDPTYGVTVPNDWIDLFLLSQCDYLVISGSTFGVWGALLSNCPPDHVVRPDYVYGPALCYIDSELLFDPKWRVIGAS